MYVGNTFGWICDAKLKQGLQRLIFTAERNIVKTAAIHIIRTPSLFQILSNHIVVKCRVSKSGIPDLIQLFDYYKLSLPIVEKTLGFVDIDVVENHMF